MIPDQNEKPANSGHTVANRATRRGFSDLEDAPRRATVATVPHVDLDQYKNRKALNLRDLRKAAHLTQEQLGVRTGTRREEVNLYEHGRRPISDAKLVAFARELGVDPGWLCLDHGNTHKFEDDGSVIAIVNATGAEVNERVFPMRRTSA